MTGPLRSPWATPTPARADDEVTLLLPVRQTQLKGWTDVRVTAGIERCPTDFVLQMTDFFPADGFETPVQPGDACQLLLGTDVVVTGYVDRVLVNIDAKQHTVTVTGRGKCQDLVDCSATYPNGQIIGASALEIARKLAEPYGITVAAAPGEDVGPPIPQMNLVYGETAYSVIEFVCRYRGLLAYELPDGSLYLARASKKRGASGFQEGVNIISGSGLYSMDQRFRTIDVFGQAQNLYAELPSSALSAAVAEDDDVPRYRNLSVVCEAAAPGLDIQQRRADWEKARRRGRGSVVSITTDGWRDKSGTLYAINTQVPVTSRALRAVTTQLWTIAEVTYSRGAGGTTADVVLMPPQAFEVQPMVIVTYETKPLSP